MVCFIYIIKFDFTFEEQEEILKIRVLISYQVTRW